MIHKDSLSEDWIIGIAKKYSADPILVEKVIRALYLLELLQKAEIDFVFKGGTALMLLLSEPKRFSIDIDIIISEKLHRIEDVFSILIQESEFIHFKVDKRTDLSKIEKAHYKILLQARYKL